MRQPRLSVAMCTYNGARFLREQLESIGAQTLPPDEMIVCDDGSADDTLHILRAFAERARFPVQVHSNRLTLGPAKNFEQAIRLCQGEVIALSDQDDIWKPQKLEALAHVLEENPGADYVFSDANIVDVNGRIIHQSLWALSGFRKLVAGPSFRKRQLGILLKRNVVTGAAIAFRSRLRDMVLPIAPGWIHDYWIALVASTISWGVPVDDQLLLYRQHALQYVGVGRTAWVAQCRSSLATTEGDYQRRFDDFQALWERVCGFANSSPTAAGKVKMVEEKVLHLSRRASSQSAAGISRARIVLGETLMGRYHKFSKSWGSIVRDLWPRFLGTQTERPSRSADTAG